MSNNNTSQVIFIDAAVRDKETIISSFLPVSTWYVIKGDEDGLQQIADVVSNYSNLDAIHIISHGVEGKLLIGDAIVDKSALDLKNDILVNIGKSVGESGDILLYACEIGNDIDYLEAIAAKTGADVAASNNQTGPAFLGGDWELEKTTGPIETVSLHLSEDVAILLDVNPGIMNIFEKNGYYTTFAELSKAAYYLAPEEHLQIGQTDQSGHDLVSNPITHGAGANYVKPYSDVMFDSVNQDWTILTANDFGQISYGEFIALEVDNKAVAEALIDSNFVGPAVSVTLASLLAVTPTKPVEKTWFIENDGVYHCENAAAFAVTSGDSVVISFRGTNDNDATTFTADMLDWVYMPEHYAELQPFIDAVDRYVFENDITQVFATGHSLGGGMALGYMDKHKTGSTANGSTISYEAVTFAAPGYLLAGSIDQRVICIENDGDPVPDMKYHQGFIVSMDIGGLSNPSNGESYGTTDFHSMDLYLQGAIALDQELPDTTSNSSSSLHGLIPSMFSPIDYGLEISLRGSVVFGNEIYSWKEEAAPAYQLMINNDILSDTGNIGETDYFIGGQGIDTIGGSSLLTNPGNGVMIGGVGDDVYFIDNLQDVIIERLEEGVDSVLSRLSYSLPQNVENLSFSVDTGLFWNDTDLDGSGNISNNIITGNNGDNILTGLDGADTLDGKLGSDKLFGGLHNDILIAQDGSDILMGGTGDDQYRLERVEFDIPFSNNVPIYTLLDDSGDLDWLMLYDNDKGNFGGLEDLNFRVSGDDLYIDFDIDIPLGIDDNDDGRILIQKQGLQTNQIESLYLHDQDKVLMGGPYSLLSAYTALQQTGNSDWYRMSAGTATTEGLALQVVTGSGTSSDGSDGSTIVEGGGLALNVNRSGQLDDIGYNATYFVNPTQAGALEIYLDLYNEYNVPTFEVDVYDRNNVLLESFQTGRDKTYHIGVSSTSAHTIRLTNIGEDKNPIPLTDINNGKFTIYIKQADISIDYESELNNGFASADTIRLGRTSEGQISTSADIDWYKVTPSQVGALAIELWDNGTYDDDNYRVDVTDSTGVVLESFKHTYGTSTWHVGVASTAAHYINIRHDPDNAVDTSLYYFNVTQADIGKDYESEHNNLASTADIIALGRTTEGRLSTGEDVDWYKVTPSQVGALAIELWDSGTYDDDNYRVDVADSTGVVLESFKHTYGTSTWHVGVASTAAHYIKISHDPDNAVDTSLYYFNVTQADIRKDYESEHNNLVSNADIITLGHTTEGRLSTGEDVDWYKVTSSQVGALAMELWDSGTYDDDNYRVDVTDSTGVVLESFKHTYGTSTWHVGVASTVAHYIKISHDPDNAVDTSLYYFNVTQADISKDYESESNGLISTADTVSIGRTTEGRLSTDEDVDWYKVTPSQVGALEIKFSDANRNNGTNDFRLDITDSAGVVLETFNHYNYDSTWHVGVASTAAHYIKVSHDPGNYVDTDWYYLNVTQADITKDYESEHNNLLLSADSMVLGNITEGRLSSDADVDWYKVTPSQVGALEIKFSDSNRDSGTNDFRLDITDSAGVVLETFNHYHYDSIWHVGVDSTEAYYIKISHDPGNVVDTDWYYLKVAQADMTKGYESEDNNLLLSADFMVLGNITEGQLSTNEDVDWYKVTPSQVGALEIKFSDSNRDSGTNDFRLDVADSAGIVLETFNHYHYDSIWRVGVDSTEAYYIKISHDITTSELDTNWYTLKVIQADIKNDYESESNNIIADADADDVVLGRTTEGQLSTAIDDDWYKVTPSQVGALEIKFADTNRSNGTNDFRLEIADSTGFVLETFNHDHYDSTWYVGVDSTEALYIKISHDNTTSELDTDWYTLKVTSNNLAPTLSNAIPDQTTSQNANMSFEVPLNTFADAGDVLTYSATLSNGSVLPSWLAFDPTTRQLTGTPSNANVGYLDVKVIATDHADAIVSDTFRLTVGNVNDSPSLAIPLADINTNEDSNFSYTLPGNAFLDVDSGDTLTYSVLLADGSSLPAWLGFNATSRVFSGTPRNSDVGNIDIRVTVRDQSGSTITDDLILAVVNTNDAPYSDSMRVDVVEDATYTFRVSDFPFLDVDANATLAKIKFVSVPSSGSVKYKDISIGANSEILASDIQDEHLVYVPASNATGDKTFHFAVSDGLAYSGNATMTMSISPVNDAPVVANVIADRLATEDLALSFTLPANTFSDVDSGDSWTYSASLVGGAELPPWLQFNLATRVFSGTPANAHVGSIDIQVTATDTAEATVSDVFRILVANTNDLPATEAASVSFTEDTSYAFRLADFPFSDIDHGATLACVKIISLPNLGSLKLNGVSLANNSAIDAAHIESGKFTYTPASNFNGVSSFGFSVGDGVGYSGNAVMTLNIAAENDPPTGVVVISQGQTLIAANTLADADNPTGIPAGDIQYQWLADGVDIMGATTASLLLTQAQVGMSISIRASYLDANNFPECMTSAPTAAVLNVNDVPTGNITVNGFAIQGQRLTATSSLSDTDGMGAIHFQWQANGGDIVGATGENYVLTAAEIGKALAVTASYADHFGTAERVISISTDSVLAQINRGTPGNDTLTPAMDSDTLTGGAGDDRYIVSAHANRLTENLNEGIDTVFAPFSWTLGANLEHLQLLGTQKYSGVGNNLENLLTGNAQDNLLDGGTGVDVLIGDVGNDTYVVDHLGDVIQETGTDGSDSVLSQVDWALGDHLENLALLGTRSLSGTGNALDNQLTGNGGSNVLSGGAGNDILAGASGNDTLAGGAGADTFTFTTPLNAARNVDTITDFVSGTDGIQLSSAIFRGLGFSGPPDGDAFFHAGSTAQDADDRILYDQTAGSLYYDADGTGALVAVQFAVLGGAPVLLYTDFFIA